MRCVGFFVLFWVLLFCLGLPACSVDLDFGRSSVLSFKLNYLLVSSFCCEVCRLMFALPILYSSADRLCLWIMWWFVGAKGCWVWICLVLGWLLMLLFVCF